MTTAAGDWSAMPQELKAARQWCVAGPDRAPYALVNGQIHHCSVHKRELWKTFDEAWADAQRIGGGAGVGFMLYYEDPWTCIDLDVKNENTQRAKGEPIDASKWTTPEELARYQKILESFDSYAELSSGGYGIHIWVRGRIGAGARRQGVEVYSQERFIVCTGRSLSVPPKPIVDRQDLLELLVFEIRKETNDTRGKLEELDEEDTDAEIFDKACNAANGDKFNALCSGKWREMGFPSQSEADLALMSMLAFYSKSNEQCRRIFRCTGLGQREKATKNDRYLNFTLEVIRGRQAREAMVTEDARAMAEEYARELSGGVTQAEVSAATLAASETQPVEVAGSVDWPPGMAGAIANYIYKSSPRPVKEVAIVATLGFLAGVVGKAYTISQSGLNVYIILVARSGVGKEAMHSGISHILAELRKSIPGAEKFIDYTDFVSGPALKKAVAQNQSFCNVAGEFGRKLKKMAQDERDGPMAGLRTVMTDLYQKSGPSSLVGGMAYSDKEKNVMTVQGVAFSMIGETTPGTFYEALTQSMMEDGFLSRFTIMDYNGERPPDNTKTAEMQMHPALVQAVQGLCAQAMNLISKFANQAVEFSPEAQQIVDSFNVECDAQINGSNDESHRQMWNRAHLKVCRFAALLAVADNCLNPVVSLEHAKWALDLIRRDIYIMSNRIHSGDVGTDDHARERKMIAVLKEYRKEGVRSDAYGDIEALRLQGIVPKRFLQIRLCQIACFRNGRNGATWNIDMTAKSLQEMGYLSEVDRVTLAEKHHYHGKAYRIVQLPTNR